MDGVPGRPAAHAWFSDASAPPARRLASADMTDDVDRARELLETAKLQNISDRMLAAAQVHATLAVEAAVRDLIAVTARLPMETAADEA